MRAQDAVARRLGERVQYARRNRIALEIRGAGSKSFYGNATVGEPLELRELSGITAYEPSELIVTALGGTPLEELESALAARGQCLPFEPPHFDAQGTVGGMVAAGLSGPGRAARGPLRDFVLGMTMLNGNAELLTFGGQVMKNVAGYDVSRVVAGSLGILGVICEVSLKVMPVVAACKSFCIEADQAAALEQCARWVGAAVPVTATAWHEDQLTVRLGGAVAAVERALRASAGRELDPAEAARWWSDVRDHRHSFFVMPQAALAGGECLWRLALPDATPPLPLPGAQFIEWSGSQRWYRGTAPADRVRTVASAAGGHATLFRATDKSAGAFTLPSEPSMQVHRRLKQAFDPAGIFNPGRLYPGL